MGIPSSLLKHFFLSVFLYSVVFETVNSQYFNTRCRESSQCLSSQFLQCLNGYCQCDSRSQVFDHITNQCTMLPGKTCTPHQNNNANNYPKCSKNSACILSRCECQPGYSPSGDLVCKANFLNSCKTPQDCDHKQGLICLGGSCQCRNTTLSYQGIFGCVNPNNPEFIEMMTALKTTQRLLSENQVDLDEMINELDPSPNALDTIPLSQFQTRQLFSDSGSGSSAADSVDLTTSAQNQAPQMMQNGFQNLLGVLNTLGSLGQLLGGQNNRQATTPANNNPPPATGGNLRNLFSGFTNMLNVFNRIIPRIRNFKRMINPIRLIRRLIMNFRGQKGGYPAASRPKPTYGPPPTAYGPPPTTASPGGYAAGPAAPADPAPPPPAAPPAPSDEAPQASFDSFNTFRSQTVQPSNYQAGSALSSAQKPLSQQSSSFENPLHFQTQNSYQVQNPPQQSNFNQNLNQQQSFPNLNNQASGNNAYQTINPLQNSQLQSLNNQQFQNTNQNQNGQFQQQSFLNNQNFQAQNQNNLQNFQAQNQNNQKFQAQGQNNQNFIQSQNQNFQSPNLNNQPFQQPQQTVAQNSNFDQTFALNGFQQQSNTFGNYQPTVNQLPETSNNKYPRQERLSTTEEDSPYLPEHL